MEDVAAFRNEEKVKSAVRAFGGGGFYLRLILSIAQLYLAAGQDVTIMRSEQLTRNGVQFRERGC
jgi:hypothetical protein